MLNFALVFLPLIGFEFGETELVYKLSGIEMPGSHAAIAHRRHSHIGTGRHIEGEEWKRESFHAYSHIAALC